MAITITDLKNEIHRARYFAIIKQDYRGTPVNIVINRNNSAPTHCSGNADGNCFIDRNVSDEICQPPSFGSTSIKSV